MKKEILRNANYRYNFDRDVYFNQVTKKAFSLEFVEDHAEEEITRKIEENTEGHGWRFYFNSEPSDGVKRVLESVLG